MIQESPFNMVQLKLEARQAGYYLIKCHQQTTDYSLIRDIELQPNRAQICTSYLHRFINLQRFGLSYLYGSSIQIPNITDLLRSISHTLLQLRLGQITIKADEIEAIVRLKKLQVLDLHRCDIHHESISLTKLYNLKQLNLAFNNIDDQGLCNFYRFTQLTQLNLRSNFVSQVGAESIAKLITLVNLDISSNHIKTKGASYISRLNNLETLQISGNVIKAEGVKYLLQLQNLQDLDISNNKIKDDKGVLIEGIKRIRKLNLKNNPLTNQFYCSLLNSATDLVSLSITSTNLNHFQFMRNVSAPKLKSLLIHKQHNEDQQDTLALDNCCLTGLTAVYLLEVKIKSLESFAKLNCPLMKIELSLAGIADITPLVRFTNLRMLELYANQIKNIEILLQFPFIEEIHLGFNQIEDISCLDKASFEHLTEIILSRNPLRNVDVLSRIHFHKINYICLDNTRIISAEFISKFKLELTSLEDVFISLQTTSLDILTGHLKTQKINKRIHISFWEYEQQVKLQPRDIVIQQILY